MEFSMEGLKRKRVKPSKRWTPELKNILLQILVEKKEYLEKPTAKIFYSNIIEKHPEFRDYGWEAMRDKLKNMKRKFVKAVDWKRSSSYGLLETDGEITAKDYILKLCPEYYTLDAIFSNRKISQIDINSNDNFQSMESVGNWNGLKVKTEPLTFSSCFTPESSSAQISTEREAQRVLEPKVTTCVSLQAQKIGFEENFKFGPPDLTTADPIPSCSSAPCLTPREAQRVREAKDTTPVLLQVQQIGSEANLKLVSSAAADTGSLSVQTQTPKKNRRDYSSQLLLEAQQKRADLLTEKIKLDKDIHDEKMLLKREKLAWEKKKANQELRARLNFERWRAEQEMKTQIEIEKMHTELEMEKIHAIHEYNLKELEIRLKYNSQDKQ